MSTLMFYVSEVQLGGNTAFPRLGVTVRYKGPVSPLLSEIVGNQISSISIVSEKKKFFEIKLKHCTSSIIDHAVLKKLILRGLDLCTAQEIIFYLRFQYMNPDLGHDGVRPSSGTTLTGTDSATCTCSTLPALFY